MTKPKDKKHKTEKVDFEKFLSINNNKNRGLHLETMNQLQDSLVARGWGLPQRLAILATAAQEMSAKDGAASKGIGGNGILGYNDKRMPTSLLSTTPEGRAKQINYLFEDLLKVTGAPYNNWLDGGKGGPYIKNGQDAYDKFWASEDPEEATIILNKSNIRPAGREDAWNNRAKVASDMKASMEKKGGILKRIEKANSGIKINPENKGKFTETKERTGKTTEELTHSKNPLTRKRAIFA